LPRSNREIAPFQGYRSAAEFPKIALEQIHRLVELTEIDSKVKVM
jgi:hypothetical protein